MYDRGRTREVDGRPSTGSENGRRVGGGSLDVSERLMYWDRLEVKDLIKKWLTTTTENLYNVRSTLSKTNLRQDDY